MAASVQDLLLAAQSKQSPFAALAQGITQGFGSAQAGGLERAKTLITLDNQRREIERQQIEREQQAQFQEEMRKKIAASQEQRVTAAHSAVGGAPPPTLPTQKFKEKITRDEKGNYGISYETIESTGQDDTKTYTSEQADAIASGDVKRVTAAFGGSIPKEALNATTSVQQRETSRATSLDQKDEERIQSIRKEISGSKTYQSWTEIKTAADGIADAAANPSAKRSLAAIYSYIRALDPTSSIKEGEIKLVGEARSIADKLEGSFRKMTQGQVLNPAEIEEIAEWARTKEAIARRSAIGANNPAVEQAKRHGYDLMEINSDLFRKEQEKESLSIPTVTTQEQYDALPSGAEYIDSQGTRARKA